MFILLSAQLEEAATGLRYLHKRGIVHGNLKGVRQSPLTLLRALTGPTAQHLNYQRNTSLSGRLRTFNPHS